MPKIIKRTDADYPTGIGKCQLRGELITFLVGSGVNMMKVKDEVYLLCDLDIDKKDKDALKQYFNGFSAKELSDCFVDLLVNLKSCL